MRLYDFFKENLEREPVPVIDFHVRAERLQAGTIHFYIHPAYMDGQTLDFIVTATGAMTPMGEGGTMNKASKSKVSAAFHEVFNDKPRTVDTSKSAEGQRKQMTAIALSKARAAGANIPKMHDGGVVMEDGVYELKKGERVVPATETSTTHRPNPSGQQGLSGKCSTYSTYNDNVVPEGAATNGPTEHASKQQSAQKYPGRALPAAEKVRDAQAKSGVARSCAAKQVGNNVRSDDNFSSKMNDK